jgi:glycosyltransferase involved in cell wall biosynthesis
MEEEDELVSVIIPSYNRFKFLMLAIQSIKKQTYKNIEIIVINDCSDKEKEKYCSYDWEKNGIKIIHLETNSKEIFGYPCVGYVRNFGISMASNSNSANSANAKNAKYIFFCDDDDVFISSQKIELQIAAMKRTGCKMSCTEALFGYGEYDSSKSYSKYNAEAHIDILKNVYKDTTFLGDDGKFPEIWTKEFLAIHNCVICSSVVIEKSLLNNINNMRHLSIAAIIPEDYDCWLRATEYTNCVYIKEPCVYYDGGHGYGLNR